MDTGRIAFVGFGEAAGAFLSGWAPSDPAAISAYDKKTDDPATRADMEGRYSATGVSGHLTPRAALRGAPAVFSVVTADQSLVAAAAAAQSGALAEGAFWFDCNSCAPDTKRQAAEVIAKAGGRYVDVAIMAPVYPKRHHVPLKISGPYAKRAARFLNDLDMRPEVVGAAIGDASSIKMLRSVMIKGLEALLAECFLSARRTGVEEQVIASLEASDPDIDWRGRGTYSLERMIVHGKRRAAELREVAATVADLGLPNGMSRATADWEDRIASTGADPGAAELFGRLDRVLSKL